MDLTNDRKIEHISIIDADKEVERSKHYFDAIRLKHRALPELDLQEVDPSTTFLDKKLSFPLLISSMTGGDDDILRKINRNLAIAAEAEGVALGVGSQRVMFTNRAAKESFELRQYAPNTLLFANLGAVQLNYGFTAEHCRQAIEVVGADALYLHLNPLQESVQPEGNTNFSGLARKIGAVAKELEKPIILKEVGAGISKEDVELVLKYGIGYIDVAGTGGTSWSRIEYHRQVGSKTNNLGILFQDWGNPTPLVLKSLQPFRDRIKIIASGGVRTGIDMVKSIILGASLCGMAFPFLKPAMDSAEEVIETIRRIKMEFVVAMFLLGVPTVEQLFGNEALIANPDFRVY